MNRASAYNLQFAAPLGEKEVNGIAKSIVMILLSKHTDLILNLRE